MGIILILFRAALIVQLKPTLAFTTIPQSTLHGVQTTVQTTVIARLKSNDDELQYDYVMIEEDSTIIDRRQVLQSTTKACISSLPFLTTTSYPSNAQEEQSSIPRSRGKIFEITDKNSFSGVAYIPNTIKKSYPLLVVLHGAGNNKQQSAIDAFTTGDHKMLPPSLLYANQAPSSLSDNFIVIAPYVGKDKRSLYDEPRSKVLDFIRYFNTYIESQTIQDGTSISINRQRISLFGFSEGSTLAVELATTRQFNGLVLCSYGFTGILPQKAIERLQGIPVWIFHSTKDDVYDIKCSNQLVESLLTFEGQGALDAFSKFTKLLPNDKNDDSINTAKGEGYEHVRSALIASKSSEVYSWLLSLP